MIAILIAGMPATGKTRFAKWLSSEMNLPYISKDEIKEIMFDEIGFHSRSDKVALGNTAMIILNYFAENQMKVHRSFIIENNFEDCSKADIVKLLNQYQYRSVTVLFDGDIEVVHQRFITRDQSPDRHRGHVANTVYPEIGEKSPYIPIGLEAFRDGMENRGFRRFSVGGTIIQVDCTDFKQVNYNKLKIIISDAISDIGQF